MKNRLLFVLLALPIAVGTLASSQDKSTAAQSVPRLVKFSGKLADTTGKPASGVSGVTFALYKDQEGGAALWLETQNVNPDANGRYTVTLGAVTSGGIPSELFASGEAQWLGVQPAGESEQPRVLLVSVPYAMKAADADTIGGKPPSAFLLARPQSANSLSATSDPAGGTKAVQPLITGSGTANYLARWTSATNLSTSLIFQTPGNLLGVRTTSPAALLDVEAPTTVSIGVQGVTPSTAFFAAAVFGHATGTSGVTRGVYGVSDSSGGIGVHGIAAVGGQFETGSGIILKGRGLGFDRFSFDANGNMTTSGTINSTVSAATGIQGSTSSTAFFAAAVFGHATGTSGVTRGVYGVSDSSGGIGVHGIAAVGGQFETGNGTEIIGRGLGHTNFRVDDTGKVFADGGFQTGGADFAESFAVHGDRKGYEAGDLLAIDRNSRRQIALANRPYSKLVAGIYSTQPGLLGTTHTMFDKQLTEEIPLAVVGVVPCKVTNVNGPIRPGDLLVASSTPGYAMKGTDRNRMLGAVVGKALEPLDAGKEVIQVLVTLQ